MTDQADTPDPIGEWLALADEATTGPWVYDGQSIIWTGLTRDELIQADDLLEAENEVAAGDILDRGGSLFSGDPERDEDAEFIAASRNVVPAVRAALAELAAARAENERHEYFMRAIKDCRKDPASAIAQNDIINGQALIRAHIAETELAAARDREAAVRAETHLDDGLPILAPEGMTDQWVEGWDYAIDEMWRRVRAALGESVQSEQPTKGASE